MAKYRRIPIKGVTFVLTLEEDQVDMLHIFARHLKDEYDVAYFFFNGTTEWKEELRCFETVIGDEGLRWFWLQEPTVVMVVSCFDLYN